MGGKTGGKMGPGTATTALHAGWNFRQSVLHLHPVQPKYAPDAIYRIYTPPGMLFSVRLTLDGRN